VKAGIAMDVFVVIANGHDGPVVETFGDGEAAFDFAQELAGRLPRRAGAVLVKHRYIDRVVPDLSGERH
jgi:hypothetical protein